MSAPLQFDAKVDATELNRLLGELTTGGQAAARALNAALGGTVTKKLVLETVTDESGSKRLLAVEKERLSIADAITREQAKLSKVNSGSATSLRGQLREASQLRDGLLKIENGVDKYGNAVRRINPYWTEANAKVRELSRELQIAGASNFWQELKARTGLGGILSIGNGLNQVVQTLQSASILVGQFTGALNTLVRSAAEVQSIGLSFEAINQGAIGGVVALQESARIATGLGVSLDTVQTGFQQLAPVVTQTGGTMEDVSAITEALSSRFVAFGISGDRARRVMQGVIQAFAKGKLQAEELTQQISEADPAFKTDFAGALGISVQELEKWVKAGKVNVEVLREILPRLSKAGLLFGKLGVSAEEGVNALENNAVTIDQVRNNLQNLNKLSLRRLALIGEPLVNSLLRVQAVVTDLFTGLSQSSTTEALIGALGNAADAGLRLLSAFSTVAQGLLTVLSPIAKLIEFLSGIPGVVEIAGLALLGKLLGPTQAVGKQFTTLGGIISRFWAGLQDGAGPAAGAIGAATVAVDNLGDAISDTSGAGLGDGISKQMAQAAAASSAAADTIARDNSLVLRDLEKQYRDTYNELRSIEKQRAQQGTTADSSEPLRQTRTATDQLILAQNELRDSSSALGDAGRIAAGGINSLGDNLGNIGGAIGEAEARLSRFGELSRQLPTLTGSAFTNAAQELNTLGGEIDRIGLRFDNALGRFDVDPEFFGQTLNELENVDPSRSLLLTQRLLDNLQTTATDFGRAMQEGTTGLSVDDANQSFNQLNNTIGIVEDRVEKLKRVLSARLEVDAGGQIEADAGNQIAAQTNSLIAAEKQFRQSLREVLQAPGATLDTTGLDEAGQRADAARTKLEKMGAEIRRLSGFDSSQPFQGVVGSADAAADASARAVNANNASLKELEKSYLDTYKKIERLELERAKVASKAAAEGGAPDTKKLEQYGNRINTLREDLSGLQARITAVTSEPLTIDQDGIKGSRAAVQGVVDALFEQELAIRDAADATTKGLQQDIKNQRSKVAGIRQQIDALRELEKQQAKASGVEDTRALSSPLVESLRAEEAELSRLESAYADNRAAARASVAASVDLSNAYRTLGDATATYKERLAASRTLTGALEQQYKQLQGQIESTTATLSNALRQRNAEQGRLAVGGLSDEDAATARANISALDGVIASSEAKLNRLDGQLRSTGESMRYVGAMSYISERGLLTVSAAATATGGRLAGVGRAARGFGNVVRGGLAAAGQAANGLLQQLGPLEVIMISAAIAGKAFADINRESNAILSESAARVKAYRDEIAKLEPVEPEQASGLELAWQKLGLTVDAIVRGITGGIEQINSAKIVGNTEVNDLIVGLGKLIAVAASAGLVFATLSAGAAKAAATLAAAQAAAGASAAAIAGTTGAVVGAGSLIAPVTAVIVAAVAAYALFASAGGEASVAAQKLAKDIKATGTSAETEAKSLNQLAQATLNYIRAREGRAPSSLDEDGGLLPEEEVEAQSNFTQVTTGLQLQQKKLEELKNNAAVYRKELEEIPAAVRRGIDALDRRTGIPALDKFLTALTPNSRIADALKQEGISVTPEQIDSYRALQLLLKETESAIPGVATEVGGLTKSQAELAGATGNLTAEQEKNAETLTNLGETLKSNEEKIKNLVPNTDEWAEANKLIGETRVKIEQLNQSAAGEQAAASFDAISKKLGSGEVPESLNNLQFQLKELQTFRATVDIDSGAFVSATADAVLLEDNLKRIESQETEIEIETIIKGLESGAIATSFAAVQGLKSKLEAVAISLDINSPKLPETLKRLVETEEKTRQLDGLRATMTINLIEEGLRDGSITDSLGTISTIISELDKRKAGLSINSAEVDDTIEAIRRLNVIQEQSSKSSEELRTNLAKYYWEAEIRSIERAERVEQKRHQQRQRNLDAELSQIRKQAEAQKAASDAAIKRLQDQIPDPSKGPAARALAREQNERLRKEAQSTDRNTRLQAQAQLEALKYAEEEARINERIKREQEEQARRDAAVAAAEKAIQEEKQREEEAFQKRQEAREEKTLALQEAIAESTRKLADSWVDVAKAILGSRDAARAYNEEVGQQPTPGAPATASAPQQGTATQGGTTDSGQIQAATAGLRDYRSELKATGVDTRAATDNARGYGRALMEINGVRATGDIMGEVFTDAEGARRLSTWVDQWSIGMAELVSRAKAAGLEAGQAVGDGLASGGRDAAAEAANTFRGQLLEEAGRAGAADRVAQSLAAGVANYGLAVDNLATAQQKQAAIQQALNTAIASGASDGVIGTLSSQLRLAAESVVVFSNNAIQARAVIQSLAEAQGGLGGLDNGANFAPDLLNDLGAIDKAFAEVSQSAASFGATVAQASGADLGASLDSATAATANLSQEAAGVGEQLSNASVDATLLGAGTATAQAAIEAASSAAATLASGTSEATAQAGELAGGAATASEGIQQAESYSQSLAGQLSNAADQASRIADEITSLDGTSVTVRVNVIPSRWTGGDVKGGTRYQVNELGQEGFLSASGAMRPIRAPRNALWRAPSSGTVIPAHIWRDIQAPSGRIAPTAAPAMPNALVNRETRMQRALMSALMQRQPQADGALQELASVQARQALEIGKLSSAVDELNKKDWNVNVQLKTTGGSTYMDAINRAL